MTAPDPGLTDLIAAHTLSGPFIEYDSDGHHVDDIYLCGKGCKWTSNDDMVNRSPFAAHAAHVAEVLFGSYYITPKLIAKPGIPCGDWADGHSYRKCTRAKGHEGHHG